MKHCHIDHIHRVLSLRSLGWFRGGCWQKDRSIWRPKGCRMFLHTFSFSYDKSGWNRKNSTPWIPSVPNSYLLAYLQIYLYMNGPTSRGWRQSWVPSWKRSKPSSMSCSRTKPTPCRWSMSHHSQKPNWGNHRNICRVYNFLRFENLNLMLSNSAWGMKRLLCESCLWTCRRRTCNSTRSLPGAG